MLKPRILPRAAHRPQRGFTLIEGLVSILIFSIGVLALVGLQTTSIRQSTQSQYRGDASLLANELVGGMWAAEGMAINTASAALAHASFLAELQAQYAGASGSGGAQYMAWFARVSAALPGTAANQPSVVVNGATGQVTITISWKAPNEPAAEPVHNFVTATQISRY